jgi:hypothetical protein
VRFERKFGLNLRSKSTRGFRKIARTLGFCAKKNPSRRTGCRINGGGSRIRTYVDVKSADLQSAAIDRSAIPPTKENAALRYYPAAVNVDDTCINGNNTALRSIYFLHMKNVQGLRSNAAQAVPLARFLGKSSCGSYTYPARRFFFPSAAFSPNTFPRYWAVYPTPLATTASGVPSATM